jgi:glutathione S-transferase
MKLYHSAISPNSRRVRIFLAEKGLSIPLVTVDLGKGEQHSDAYRAINPRRVVPKLVLEDGTTIGEEAHPTPPLLGETAREKALVAMWERRAELEGFAAVMEAIRNTVPGLKGRAIAGPHDYEQLPELAERSKLRVKNFFADFDDRLDEAVFAAGQRFSVADITVLVTVDFAVGAINFPVSDKHRSLKRWYEAISSRPSLAA